ncbi:hypothetical protein [Marinomonas lutimaris]|uniref:hypothetical protein n=1 Tax=Marinomonas lutimaris TaxID=2846746 RepID=UPI001CA48D8A|nr:hypothetical protein [Marinomonas lutimaris]
MLNNKVRNLIRMFSDIKALKTLSIISDIINQKTTVMSEQISSLLACVVESMEESQESLVVALQEST